MVLNCVSDFAAFFKCKCVTFFGCGTSYPLVSVYILLLTVVVVINTRHDRGDPLGFVHTPDCLLPSHDQSLAVLFFAPPTVRDCAFIICANIFQR